MYGLAAALFPGAVMLAALLLERVEARWVSPRPEEEAEEPAAPQGRPALSVIVGGGVTPPLPHAPEVRNQIHRGA